MIQFDTYLKEAKTVAITGHVRPDGDCLGTTLGFYNYIKENYPEVLAQVFLEPAESALSYLPGIDEVCHDLSSALSSYDLLCVFDCGGEARFEPFQDLITRAKCILNLDHHLGNTNFAHEIYCVPECSSACELLYTCLTDEKITKDVATCLYTGMVTDTGIFRFQSVTPRTMEIAGALMRKGIDHTRIVDTAYFQKTFAQNKVLGLALDKAILFHEDKAIFSYITKQEREAMNLSSSEMGGVIDQLRNTEGIEVAVFAYELEENDFKISMRARDLVDVSLICNHFGGGGHMRAAGCNMITDSVDHLLKAVDEQIGLALRRAGLEA
ncbi:MAG: bifunctional oligoribonuclease/PAP phosphatase NrnA [Lachnospiraceae bacterium]|nr:bifunctional oligoribonuclease/PAP phosphatase NrnA [Lachnospiraceae bacterium]